MERILIIEDERDVNQLLAKTLQEGGYQTISAFDGLQGSRILEKESFDMVLLDLMIPYKSGDEVLKQIRECSDIPVIIISAKDLTGTKIDLLTMGADDYITKPFDLGEVAARVAANLRRCRRAGQKEKIVYQGLVLDRESKSVTLNGIALDLTAKEYQMMELFLQFPDKVFSKANLYETIWDEEYLGDDNVVKTHISNLRSKMKKADAGIGYIETVWGLGYRLVKNSGSGQERPG